LVSLDTERFIEKSFWIFLVVVACTKEPQAAEHWCEIFPIKICIFKALGEAHGRAHGRALGKAMKISNSYSYKYLISKKLT